MTLKLNYILQFIKIERKLIVKKSQKESYTAFFNQINAVLVSLGKTFNNNIIYIYFEVILNNCFETISIL